MKALFRIGSRNLGLALLEASIVPLILINET